jgi:sulfatase maturation enzyme AslB (radical SAM superfamily)
MDDVIVSFDGPAPVHDAIRRTPDAFAMLRRGVRALNGFPVAARCVV